MNFLAHLHLADDEPDVQLGSLLADFLKGPMPETLPPGVQRGIRQHRAIDGFTDRNPQVVRSITRLSTRWGWFSGIIIDVYYDHLLVRSWPQFSAEPFAEFTARMYRVIRGGAQYFEALDSNFADRFPADDRLTLYGTTTGIADTLARVSDRIAKRIPKRAVRLEHAMPELQELDPLLMMDFQNFYPELMRFAPMAGRT